MALIAHSPSSSRATDCRPVDPLRFDTDGAERFAGGALAVVDALLDCVSTLPRDQAGVRLSGVAGLACLLSGDGVIGRLAAKLAGPAARPVRAILFDKNPGANWSLGWHQDRTICVRERRAVAGFGPWTVKAGLLHVAPPIDVLARMATLRIHLDDVQATNAPLMVAPGSHRLGLVREADVPAAVAQCGVHRCLAKAGDIWAYATPILHASQAAAVPHRRRVLQVDFAGFDLPGGLAWSGV